MWPQLHFYIDKWSSLVEMNNIIQMDCLVSSIQDLVIVQHREDNEGTKLTFYNMDETCAYKSYMFQDLI